MGARREGREEEGPARGPHTGWMEEAPFEGVISAEPWKRRERARYMGAGGGEEGCWWSPGWRKCPYTLEAGHTGHGMRKSKESRPTARFPGLIKQLGEQLLWRQPWAAGQAA